MVNIFDETHSDIDRMKFFAGWTLAVLVALAVAMPVLKIISGEAYPFETTIMLAYPIGLSAAAHYYCLKCLERQR